MKQILESKNGLLQVVLAALLFLAAAFGLEPQALAALVAAVIAFVGVFGAWLRKGIRFRWDSNAWTYLVAFLLVALPSWEAVWSLLPPLFEAIAAKNINLIIAAGIAIANVLLKRFGAQKSPAPGGPGQVGR